MPGYNYFKVHFESVPPPDSSTYIIIGYYWADIKTKYLDIPVTENEASYFKEQRDRMIKNVINKFKNFARQKGSDAVIDIKFQGQYIDSYDRSTIYASSQTYKKVNHHRILSENLRGTLIRYSN